MWFKIDEHELAIYLALEGEPYGEYERDMYGGGAPAGAEHDPSLRRAVAAE